MPTIAIPGWEKRRKLRFTEVALLRRMCEARIAQLEAIIKSYAPTTRAGGIELDQIEQAKQLFEGLAGYPLQPPRPPRSPANA